MLLEAKKMSGDMVHRMEASMRWVSIIVSAVALALMFYGFVSSLAVEPAFSIPGSSVIPIRNLVYPQNAPLGLVPMSAGIILLAILPSVRVLLAMWLYFRLNDRLDALVTLVVLVELLLSMHLAR